VNTHDFDLYSSSVLKHLASTLSTILDRATISNLIGTSCELIRTADLHVKSVKGVFLLLLLFGFN